MTYLMLLLATGVPHRLRTTATKQLPSPPPPHPSPRGKMLSLAPPLASMHTLSGLRSLYAICLLCRCLSARASCAAHTLLHQRRDKMTRRTRVKGGARRGDGRGGGGQEQGRVFSEVGVQHIVEWVDGVLCLPKYVTEVNV